MGALDISGDALVVLIGPAGSGKTTFARQHFRATEILSSDHFRGMVADDEADQSATDDAFELLELAAVKRLRRGRRTVVDATNLESFVRFRWIDLAARHGRPAIAIVLRVAAAQVLEWNAGRPERRVAADAVRRQIRALDRAMDGLAREGFAEVHVVNLADPVSPLASRASPPAQPRPRE